MLRKASIAAQFMLSDLVGVILGVARGGNMKRPWWIFQECTSITYIVTKYEQALDWRKGCRLVLLDMGLVTK